MGHLADELDVALPNATGIVNRMAERGLVDRRDDLADRRVVLVSLTDAGHRLIGDLETGRRERMSRLIAELDPDAAGASAPGRQRPDGRLAAARRTGGTGA